MSPATQPASHDDANDEEDGDEDYERCTAVRTSSDELLTVSILYCLFLPEWR